MVTKLCDGLGLVPSPTSGGGSDRPLRLVECPRADIDVLARQHVGGDLAPVDVPDLS